MQRKKKILLRPSKKLNQKSLFLRSKLFLTLFVLIAIGYSLTRFLYSPVSVNQVATTKSNPFAGAKLSGGTTEKPTTVEKVIKAVTTPKEKQSLGPTTTAPKNTTTESVTKPKPKYEAEEESSEEKFDNTRVDGGVSNNDSGGRTVEIQTSGTNTPSEGKTVTETPKTLNSGLNFDLKESSTDFGQLVSGTTTIDKEGNKINIETKSEKAADGTTLQFVTKRTTKPNGDQITLIETKQHDSSNNLISENTLTIKKTRLENGEYVTSVDSTGGGSTTISNSNSLSFPIEQSNNPFAGSSLQGGVNNPDGPQGRNSGNTSPGLAEGRTQSSLPATSPTILNHSTAKITCPSGTQLVTTSVGIECVSLDKPKCGDGVYGYYNDADKKCYWIGDKVPPNNEVCDWTLGQRIDQRTGNPVQYAYLSTNCPTKSNAQGGVPNPRNIQECGTIGWWSENENRCVRIGERVTNSTKIVCKGGPGYLHAYPYLSEPQDCPDKATQPSGILPQIEPETVPTNPAMENPNSNNGRSADAQLNSQNRSTRASRPSSCYNNSVCGEGGTCDGQFLFLPGKCKFASPTPSSEDEASERNRPSSCGGFSFARCDAGYTCEGDSLFSSGTCQKIDSTGGRSTDIPINNPTGTADTTVSRPDQCLLDGATANGDGTYNCPRRDGLVIPKLENNKTTFCIFSDQCGPKGVCNRETLNPLNWHCEELLIQDN